MAKSRVAQSGIVLMFCRSPDVDSALTSGRNISINLRMDLMSRQMSPLDHMEWRWLPLSATLRICCDSCPVVGTLMAFLVETSGLVVRARLRSTVCIHVEFFTCPWKQVVVCERTKMGLG